MTNWTLEVVISGKWVERSYLHPPSTQFLSCVLYIQGNESNIILLRCPLTKEPTNIGAYKRNSEQLIAEHHWNGEIEVGIVSCVITCDWVGTT